MRIDLITSSMPRLTLQCGKLNIIYGHSCCGKTQFLNTINDGFNAKSKSSFHVNGQEVVKSEYEVLNFDAKHDFTSQAKLDSRSLLRKIIFEMINEQVESSTEKGDDFITQVNSYFHSISDPINHFMDEMNRLLMGDIVKGSLSLQSINDILPMIFSLIYLDDASSCSSSQAKLLLYSLVLNYMRKYPKKYIVTIDNFDSDLDEESTLRFLDFLKNNLDIDAYFFLTTNKGQSLQHVVDTCKIFCLRNNKIFNMSKMTDLLRKSKAEEVEKEHYSYEEYILNTPYINNEIIVNDYSMIRKNISYSIGRIFTNNQISIYNVNDSIETPIYIIANNKVEYRFYSYINQMINQ